MKESIETPDSYPDESLEGVVETAVKRYEEGIDRFGPGDGWKDCSPEDLRAEARENLVHASCDEDYADALNYILMARRVDVINGI